MLNFINTLFNPNKVEIEKLRKIVDQINLLEDKVKKLKDDAFPGEIAQYKEELKRGRVLSDSVHEGFARAWLSIRDSNLSSIITAIILYSFASTALVKGFALVFFIGVIVSMFTAITVSRTLLLSIMPKVGGKISHFLFGNGLN